jgi:polysaccharide deacetylase family protein (PEP-CTERM system associated)
MTDTLAAPLAAERAAAALPAGNIVFTVDVEDWHHGVTLRRALRPTDDRLRAGLTALLDLLDESAARATFFWLGDAIRLAPDLLLRAAAAGHEIALHHLHHRCIYCQSPAEFRRDVIIARALLEDHCGLPVQGFRAPYFSITGRSLWALGILAELGFDYDASILPTRHYRAGLPGSPPHPYRVRTSDGELWELPVSAVRRLGAMIPVGGGAYFRLYPERLIHCNIAKFCRSGFAPVLYVHPWELDPGQPRERLPIIERFAHYYGLNTTHQRLQTVLKSVATMSAAEYVKTLSAGKKL